jgi:RNA polymerase sigma factor (sigma-70 family)
MAEIGSPLTGRDPRRKCGDVLTFREARSIDGAVAAGPRPPTIFLTSIRLPSMDALAGLLPSAHLTMNANARRFTEIVVRERSRLGNFIRGQVRDAAEAEDILQDVLLEFYAATDAIEQAGAWLFRVAKNRIIDRARKKKEEPLPDSSDEYGRSWLEANLPDPSAGPEAVYARSVLLGSIQAALQTLPPEQRHVFVAHEIEGVSFADMSAQWHVPQNTLLARKRYAVLALRSRLRAEYGDLIV